VCKLVIRSSVVSLVERMTVNIVGIQLGLLLAVFRVGTSVLDLFFVFLERGATLDHLGVERETAAGNTSGEQDDDAEDGELDTSDLFEHISRGDLLDELLVDPFAENGREDSVHDNVGDVDWNRSELAPNVERKTCKLTESHDSTQGTDIRVNVLHLGQA
jgi:hypothetical protein